MESALKLIFDIIILGLVPLLLIIYLFLINFLCRKITDKKYQASARAGFWAGFIFFIIILTYQIGIFLKTGFPSGPLFRGFNIWLALLGAVVTLTSSNEGKRMLPPKFTGWIILVLSFSCFYALFHYLFIRTSNEILLSLILGITFGILAHIVASPTIINEFIAFLKSNH